MTVDTTRWYVLHTLSGVEERVKGALEYLVQQKHLEDEIEEVVVPEKLKIRSDRGEKRTMKEKIFPGYVLVKMKLTSENRYLVKQVQGVIDFIKIGQSPQPLTEEEVDEVFGRIKTAPSEIETRYAVGDTVKVLSGPFTDALGKVKEIEQERRKVKILVSIFGRDTQVELDFEQVESFELEGKKAEV